MTRVVVISLTRMDQAYFLAHELVRLTLRGRGGAVLYVHDEYPRVSPKAKHFRTLLIGLFGTHPGELAPTIQVTREAERDLVCVLVEPAALPVLLPQVGQVGQTLALQLPDRHAAEAQAVTISPLLGGPGEAVLLIVDAPEPRPEGV